VCCAVLAWKYATRGTEFSARLPGDSSDPVLNGPCRDLNARSQTEAVQDALNVAFGGPFGNDQTLGDLAVCAALGNQSYDLEFAPTQARRMLFRRAVLARTGRRGPRAQLAQSINDPRRQRQRAERFGDPERMAQTRDVGAV
jgi:hypothetical protein